ncbi:MAG TPA: helix-turn-helix transcriptional regulator [Solirubrobacteraceae bacterium]|nr:helix-turn-helix transcriptional regulator [Solirubrobacteraceae bacterium]
MHEQPDPVLAAVVKQLREERDITQEELAYEAGITVSSLSRIERGLNSPGWMTVSKIIKALGVSLAELVEDLERPPPEASGPQGAIQLRGGPRGASSRPIPGGCRHMPQ